MKDQSNRVTPSNNYGKSSYPTNINRGLLQYFKDESRSWDEVQVRRYWWKPLDQDDQIQDGVQGEFQGILRGDH